MSGKNLSIIDSPILDDYVPSHVKAKFIKEVLAAYEFACLNDGNIMDGNLLLRTHYHYDILCNQFDDAFMVYMNFMKEDCIGKKISEFSEDENEEAEVHIATYFFSFDSEFEEMLLSVLNCNKMFFGLLTDFDTAERMWKPGIQPEYSVFTFYNSPLTNVW